MTTSPILVMPMHDPTGLMFQHLQLVTAELKRMFAQGFVSVTSETRQAQSDNVTRLLEADPFFHVVSLPADLDVGEQFHHLYTVAADSCRPEQLLHLCFIDRVAFALQTEHREPFVADIGALQPEDTPLLYQRSRTAWLTHPQNYRYLEQMVTQAGCLLYGKSLDFAWCHLVVKAGRLQQILPQATRLDLTMMAELVLLLQDEICTVDVDWLAWEDPFILGQDPQKLRKEREKSSEETRKRLRYVIPMLALLEHG